MNTPFQWVKQVASHYGGTRNPMIISWPNRIKEEHYGQVRKEGLSGLSFIPFVSFGPICPLIPPPRALFPLIHNTQHNNPHSSAPSGTTLSTSPPPSWRQSTSSPPARSGSRDAAQTHACTETHAGPNLSCSSFRLLAPYISPLSHTPRTHTPTHVQVNGVNQRAIEGVSMIYTFDNPDAESKRETQYFEMVRVSFVV